MDDSTKRQMKIMKKRRTELGFRQEDVAEEAGISLKCRFREEGDPGKDVKKAAENRAAHPSSTPAGSSFEPRKLKHKSLSETIKLLAGRNA